MNPILAGIPLGVLAGLLVIAGTCAFFDWVYDE